MAKNKKWLQEASKKIREEGNKGKFTKWCKNHGHDGVTQTCINEAFKAGGAAKKMAIFAANANEDKFNIPESTEEK